MAVVFPQSPTSGQLFESSGRSFVFRTPPGVWESVNFQNQWIEGGVAVSYNLDTLDGGTAVSDPEPITIVKGLLQIGV
jgi:hypothetical protein